MKIITVLVGDVYGFPPVLNLLKAFEKIGVNSTLITTKARKKLKEEYTKTNIEELDLVYEDILSPVKKMFGMPAISNKLWKLIEKYYDDESIIWVVTDVTIKYLGNRLLTKRYILHLMELSEKLYYYYRLPMLKLNEEKIGNKALAVIVPEYNRAQITKAWWKLERIPLIIPNKPYVDAIINKNAIIEDKNAEKIIRSIGDKKIILYQGIMSAERPLDMFIDAVDEYEGKYAFVVMSGGENIYKNHKSANYYFIPFVTPPKHLQITSHAFIGILSYVPTNSTGYSPLNSLYCAPNKTFEYSMFGIPMIGNNIPGLKFLFDTQKNGICFESFSKKDICDAIDRIEKDYDMYSSNSLEYFNSCDYEKIVRKILKEIEF